MHVITSHVKMEALVLHMKMHMCVHVHQVIVEQTVNYVRKNIFFLFFFYGLFIILNNKF